MILKNTHAINVKMGKSKKTPFRKNLHLLLEKGYKFDIIGLKKRPRGARTRRRRDVLHIVTSNRRSVSTSTVRSIASTLFPEGMP